MNARIYRSSPEIHFGYAWSLVRHRACRHSGQLPPLGCIFKYETVCLDRYSVAAAAFRNVSGCGLLISTSSALTIALKYLRISSWSRTKSILKGDRRRTDGHRNIFFHGPYSRNSSSPSISLIWGRYAFWYLFSFSIDQKSISSSVNLLLAKYTDQQFRILTVHLAFHLLWFNPAFRSLVQYFRPGPDMKFHIIDHGTVEVEYQCPEGGIFHNLIKKQCHCWSRLRNSGMQES